MFLVDSARAGSDWDGINAAIKKILERAEADIVSVRKWDDRRLAYEIKHVGRGTYILVYFRAEGQAIQGIEKAVQLSDHILRVLILNAEHMTTEDMQKDTPASKAEKEETQPAPAAETAKEDRAKSSDDQDKTPVAEESEETTEEKKTVDEAGTKDVAETAEKAEDVEPAEGEDESQPKTAVDD
jgi:small subunit ribosomal protein S6